MHPVGLRRGHALHGTCRHRDERRLRSEIVIVVQVAVELRLGQLRDDIGGVRGEAGAAAQPVRLDAVVIRDQPLGLVPIEDLTRNALDKPLDIQGLTP